MNFIEAALQILEEVEKPLHYKKITLKAQELQLLDHIGNNPEKRMLEVLKIEARKNPSRLSITKPGTFVLKKFFKTKAMYTLTESEKKLYELKSDGKESLQTNSLKEEFQNIAEFSKQIYNGRYFSSQKIEKSDSELEQIVTKIYQITTKHDIPEALIKSLLKKEARYYSISELMEILKEEYIFDATNLKNSDLSGVIRLYNKNKSLKEKREPFWIHNQQFAASELFYSPDLYQIESFIQDKLKEKEHLLKKDTSKWLYRLNQEQFINFISTIFEKIGLSKIEKLNSPDYYKCSMKIGLSELPFIVQFKRAATPVNKNEIIEFRGMLPKFASSNGIIITTSYFDDNAKEEANFLTSTNIMLIDRNFLIEKMSEHNIGMVDMPSGEKRVDHHYFLTL
ncbi:restriction endonuclease [bacterium]|nr:restriction endonuclease [bacterium]